MTTTNAQKLIEQKEAEIEQIRASAFLQDVQDIVGNAKKHTEEEIANACKAFYDNYMRKVRQANLVKARTEKEEKKKTAPPA